MKSIAIILSSISMLLLLTCGGDDNPTEPDDGYDLVGSETIGPDGGTFEVGKFTLTVPEGAFGADIELSLYVSDTDRPMGEYAVSKTYRIEGLPDEYSEPLHLRIKYDGTLEELSFIAFGEVKNLIGIEGLDYIYDLLEAADSSGYLVGDLPATASNPGFAKTSYSSSSAAGNVKKLILVSKYGRSSTGHFDIIHPFNQGDVIDSLVQMLESAYDTVEAMEFSYHNQQWPIVVPVIHCEKGHAAFSTSDDKPRIYVNSDSLEYSQISLVRSDVCSAFFMLVPYLYVDWTTVNEAEHIWLHVANSLWFAEIFSDSPDYIPPRFINYEMAPFLGMRAGATNVDRSVNHGFGMTSMIEYLTQNYHESVLKRIYDGIETGGHSPVEAVMQSIEEPVEVWWPDFFKEYLSGNLYNVAAETFMGEASGTFNIRGENDTLTTFTGSYPELSAKIYIVNLNYADIDTSAKLMFTVDGDSSTAMAFGWKDGALEYFAHAETLVVSNLRDLIDNGYDHIVVVPVYYHYHWPNYNSSRDIELKIRVTKQQPLPYIRGRVDLRFLIHYIRDDGYESCDSTYSKFWIADGTTSGNTFHGTLDTSWHGDYGIGSVTITVDPLTLSVTSFAADCVEARDGSYMSYSLEGVNIPMNSNESSLECMVEGAETCDHITSADYYYEVGETYFDLYSFECITSSYIRVQLWD
ncbi:MAG: hypothetical protein GY839_08665 [candidate division Zixibacteria bacterium]|nr:hypothetical protein [candidate division Zixibacteria bacterium]